MPSPQRRVQLAPWTHDNCHGSAAPDRDARHLQSGEGPCYNGPMLPKSEAAPHPPPGMPGQAPSAVWLVPLAAGLWLAYQVLFFVLDHTVLPWRALDLGYYLFNGLAGVLGLGLALWP